VTELSESGTRHRVTSSYPETYEVRRLNKRWYQFPWRLIKITHYPHGASETLLELASTEWGLNRLIRKRQKPKPATFIVWSKPISWPAEALEADDDD
jgi:hypothetical protein